MKKVFLDYASLGDDLDFDILAKDYNVALYKNTDDTEILARAKDASVIITNKVILDKAILSQLDSLKKIIVVATGVNNIDVGFVREKNIELVNAKNYASFSVAYHTFAMYYYFNQNLQHYRKFTQDLSWSRHHSFSYFQSFSDFSGEVWGIIGPGAIGLKVAEMAKSLGAKVLLYGRRMRPIEDENISFVSLDELLEKSTVVSIHCSLNESSENLIGTKELARLKNCHTLLNLARGEIINDNELASFLEENQKIKVGLDVITGEPYLEKSPLAKFLTQERFLVTPHMSWASKQARSQLLDYVIKNLS